jgi:hypothetical protein
MVCDDLALQQQALEAYIREVEAEYEWQLRRLRLTRNVRQQLHRMRKLLEIHRVRMIVGSIAIVLAAAVLAGATGHGPLAPLLTRQNTAVVQRHVLTPPPRPSMLPDRKPAVPLGRCTNYMSDDGYQRWLSRAGSQPVCP